MKKKEKGKKNHTRESVFKRSLGAKPISIMKLLRACKKEKEVFARKMFALYPIDFFLSSLAEITKVEEYRRRKEEKMHLQYSPFHEKRIYSPNKKEYIFQQTIFFLILAPFLQVTGNSKIPLTVF